MNLVSDPHRLEQLDKRFESAQYKIVSKGWHEPAVSLDYRIARRAPSGMEPSMIEQCLNDKDSLFPGIIFPGTEFGAYAFFLVIL